MKPIKILRGTAGGISAIISFILYFCGGLIHLWSVFIALGEKGFIACVITFFAPVLSQIYWFFYCNGRYGGILNTYSLTILGYILSWIIVIGLGVFASSGSDETLN